MTSTRGATMIEGLGEPEQDANSALTDLDKGLRSNNVGQQCEAIVRFPRLFEKYPFPILINSSFLKLADVFRVGNNFLRLWVLRVCQESEKHLDKILNVDEFVRRVFSVIHANDPVARALSLRTLGSVACVIPERQQVHHCIRNSLDSHDTIEVEAAIYAAMQFAAQSKSFALGMCNKISDMIQGLSTPAHMKLQLIPILQYMHHDTSTAAMVRKVCTELLPKYPAKDFVITTLNTLTKLAASTLVDIPNQVELLLQYLVEDSRWGVKVVAVSGLYQLAKVSPHLWPPHCLSTAIHVARTSENLALTSMTLDLFIVLTKSPVVCHEYIDPDSELMQLCHETCYSVDLVISAKSVRILTQIVCFLYEENLPMSHETNYLSTVESLLVLMISCPERTPLQDKVLASCLQCAVTLCKVHRPLTNRFIPLIAIHLVKGSCRLLLCEALAGIAGLEPHALEPYLPDIIGAIKSRAHTPETKNLDDDAKTKVMLCTLLLQTKQPVDLDSSALAAINSIVVNIDPWCKYKVARAAARYGHFKVCGQVIHELTEKVSSEHLHFWLQGLVEISAGETALSEESIPMLERLGTAISHYNTAISSLKAGSSPSNSLAFQCEYAGLRCELLQCFSQLVASCHSLCFSPPPAIAVTLMHTTRDELQRYGHITNQLRKCAKAFRNCADLYWKLYQSAFDADPASLKNIQIIQHTCLMMAYSIECLALPNQQSDEPSLEYGLKGGSLETQIMIESCQAASKMASTMSKNTKTITHEHIDCLIKQVEILVTNPLCLPRYFFQVLQATSVKLAVSPQPKVLGESISLTSGSQLAVKVEGVIQHGTRAGLFRLVDKIVVSLTTQLFPRTNNANEKVVESSGCTMTQTVKPHKDFFTAQFLVSLGAGSAQATVTVAASVIDQDGCVWLTGPKSTLTVKQHDDPTNRPI